LRDVLLIAFFQANELINWQKSVQGLGVIDIEYENTEINIHCVFESNNEKLRVNMVIFPARSNSCLNLITF
jgi:hypothetical protein